MHCATSRKIAVSIPDGVIGFCHWHNSSDCTMLLWLTQPLTEISTRNISCGQRRPVCRADNLTTFMCRLSWNLGTSDFWNLLGLSRPVMGLLYLYLYLDFRFVLLLWDTRFWPKKIVIQVDRDSSVGIATHYGLDGQGIESRCGREFPHLYRPALGPTQPPEQWIQVLSRGKATGTWRWPPTHI